MTRENRVTVKQNALLQMLLQHPEMNLLKAATEIHLPPSTLIAWLIQPAFAARLDAVLAIRPRMLAQREPLGRPGRPAVAPSSRGRRPPPRRQPAAPPPDDPPADFADQPTEPDPPLTPEQFAELMRQARRDPPV